MYRAKGQAPLTVTEINLLTLYVTYTVRVVVPVVVAWFTLRFSGNRWKTAKTRDRRKKVRYCPLSPLLLVDLICTLPAIFVSIYCFIPSCVSSTVCYLCHLLSDTVPPHIWNGIINCSTLVLSSAFCHICHLSLIYCLSIYDVIYCLPRLCFICLPYMINLLSAMIMYHFVSAMYDAIYCLPCLCIILCLPYMMSFTVCHDYVSSCVCLIWRTLLSAMITHPLKSAIYDVIYCLSWLCIIVCLPYMCHLLSHAVFHSC